MYHVIIIEDDPMVADINQRYLKRSQGFHIQGVFQNGREALAYLATRPRVDLILLDYYTPLMNGGEFLSHLQNMDCPPSVIMVTSATDVKIVRQLLSHGVVDYLVKPFEYARFHQALERFRQTHHVLSQGESELRQEDIDRIITTALQPTTEASMGKGLNEATLQLVRQQLQQHPDEMFTSEQLAERVGLSRITIRRYVNHMVKIGEISSAVDYQTGGRPSIMYFYPAPSK